MRATTLLRSLAAAALTASAAAHAGLGLTTLKSPALAGPVTVFYPSPDADQPRRIGPFDLAVAPDGRAAPQVRGLIAISHGSGGAPWAFVDIARRLVDAGYVVVLPEHEGDNYHDHRDVGPVSWARRPVEISRAIDAVLADARWSATVPAQRIGMYGMSAGGHTALALAGGRWSPARLAAHCEADLAQDFHTCVGLAAELTGGALDGLKLAAARQVIRAKLTDATPQGHTDPRIRAIVAEVPLAADFDPATLRQPVAPLALVRLGADRWLVPRFNIDVVRAACAACELIVDLPQAGHGALMSPKVPNPPPLLARLLGSEQAPTPAELAQAQQRIVDFLDRRLSALTEAPAPTAQASASK